MSDKPRIPAIAVEKAQAIAGVKAGQDARAQGHSPASVKALASFGKSTMVGALELLPLSLQVQLCLMEHAKLYQDEAADAADMHTGLKRLTRMAYIFALPDEAFDTLTAPGHPEEVRREFDRQSFALAKNFPNAEAIEALSAHISAQMGLLDEASPGVPETPKKKPQVTRREKPPARR